MIPDNLTIREREDWLLDRGFNPKSIANRWITSNTYAPIEIMEVCYNYITHELGLDTKVFKNNIKLKYLYLTSEIGISNIDLERFPAAFSYSLKKRIIPRLEFAKSRNKTNLSLSSLLAPNDIVFANKMETDIAHYDVFKSENEAFIKEIYDSLTKAAART